MSICDICHKFIEIEKKEKIYETEIKKKDEIINIEICHNCYICGVCQYCGYFEDENPCSFCLRR